MLLLITKITCFFILILLASIISFTALAAVIGKYLHVIIEQDSVLASVIQNCKKLSCKKKFHE